MGFVPAHRVNLEFEVPPKAAFEHILHYLDERGFHIGASNAQIGRLVTHMPSGGPRCSCYYAVWIRKFGPKTLVTVGVTPRFGTFLLCRKGNISHKLAEFSAHIHKAMPNRSAQLQLGLVID